MKNRNLPIDDNWATPVDFYDQLNREFNFDHDPCPYNTMLVSSEKDGLNPNNKWGKRNYVNPPYSKALKDAFVKRAISECMSGNLTVMLLPVSTSTVLFHDYIKPHASEIRFLKGRIKFQKINPETGERDTPKNGGMHDSMLVIFRPNCEDIL